MTARKRGRPPKEIEPGSQDVTVRLPNECVARMEADMLILGIKQRGTYIRRLIEASADVLPMLQEKTGDIDEMRQMHRETKAMLRVIQTTQANLMRALEVDLEAEAFTPEDEPLDFVEEITSAGNFADDKPNRPTW
ncbi:hypothetical protein HFO61_30615 [Rhizobium leguminosarum]|uniref:hypothetical protein n=1 Tax=Rhizobium leguminosarum TaxID=384 RepID=UPI001C974CB4|nr:hypothetical protein [Rhizobium leguminosarum]MBY5551100.1 hypothetical protein [Rhizobium leguminosarum]